MGYNDIGYNSLDLPAATPFLDELASTGVKLAHYYTMFECTPSRAALMTGKLPISIGMQHECVTPTSEFGLPKDEATIGNHLSSNGYKTHVIGKWDLGHYSEALWPVYRGFDSFFGLTCYGYADYFTHENKGFWDLHNWDASLGRFEPDKAQYGVYSTFLFGARAVSIIQDHSPSTPLFLYVPWNAVHNEVSTPDGFLETDKGQEVIASVTFTVRQQFAGALYLMDLEVSKVVASLKTKGMYDNAIIVVASDNGGSPLTAATTGLCGEPKRRSSKEECACLRSCTPSC